MNHLNEIIDAILLNNPYAVAEKLQSLGVLQEDVYDPNYLKEVIVDAQSQLGNRSASFLEYVLDVPVNATGHEADVLVGYHLATGNKSLVRDLVRPEAKYSSFEQVQNKWSQMLQGDFAWVIKAMVILASVFFVLGIIHLIRKL